jgi:SAM-dependent methyltransferase
MLDPKERFSDRVDDYVRFRPDYPPPLLVLLQRECGLGRGRAVADVGSGTGMLTRLLLESGAQVIGVEPNAAMRAAAERGLGAELRFRSVGGSAEATGLPDASVDLITAGQAFHWFDTVRARLEFSRILKPRGWVALAWNQRKDSALNRDYVEMLERYAPEYSEVRARDRDAEPKMHAFFAPASPHVARFDNVQRLDGPGLRGRLLSSSYAPRAGHPLHAPMLARLDEIFAAHAREGRVTLAYDTAVWYGQLA